MTTTPQVPAAILTNVRQRWPNIAEAWADHVDAELHSLCDQFRATPHTILPARYGFVVAADSPNGQLVLRSSPDPHGAEQSAVAVALAELGTSPAVHHTSTSDHGTWTVLDRVQPGTTLGKADPATVKIEALFAPFASMKDQTAPLANMPSIFDWLRTRLDDDQLTDLRPGTTVAPADDRRAAHDLLAELIRGHTPGLCHGDASLSNILASGVDGWRLIDPRGMSGESAYDVAVLTVRIVQVLKSSDIVPYIASAANVDVNRVRAWMAIADAARV